ncbi:WD-40 repeat protein [Chloroherpeton thalassium ATCC 35110]|uniref:WD-40 repeat protein n=2 Tax=Chloroherpeton thalassium TaxID=100716 RepID=B3QWC1_CHLT3|nr:WD-40 repeat protein [Chloroherpeton thalassium ATCC 35110]
MEQIKSVHPDKMVGEPETVRQEAARRSQHLNQAKEILLDEEKRELYDMSYRHYMSDAAAMAAQQGFVGGSYNEYMQHSEDILLQREAYLSAQRGRTKIFIILAIIIMGSLSIIWRFFSPSDVVKITGAKEVVSYESPAFSFDAKSPQRALIFSETQNRMLSGGQDGVVHFWPIGNNSETEFASVKLPAAVFSLATVDSVIFAGTSDGSIYKLIHREILDKLSGHTDAVTEICLATESHLLASASLDKTIKIWRPETGAPVRTMMGTAFPIFSMAFAGDKKHLAFTDDRVMKVWNWTDGTFNRMTMQREKLVALAAFGDWVALAGVEQVLKQIQVKKNTIRESLPDPAILTCLAYHPSGDLLVSGGEDGMIRVYGAQSGKKLKVIKAHEARVTRLCFTKDGRYLASTSLDRTVKFWNISPDAF